MSLGSNLAVTAVTRQSADGVDSRRRALGSETVVAMKRELRLHEAEWDAVAMALSAYLGRIEDALASVEDVEGLPTAGTIVIGLTLATKGVLSLHNAIVAARDKRQAIQRWRGARKSPGVEAKPILVRHFAVAVIPAFLEDYEGRLRMTGKHEFVAGFARLRQSIKKRLAA